MSKHILDHRTPATPGLRLSRFARFGREGMPAQIKMLMRKADPRSGARLREFLRIERSEDR